MNRATLESFAALAAGRNYADLYHEINDALETEEGPHWRRDLRKIQSLLADFTADAPFEPPFKILAAGGNIKLPFLSFSVLPGVTCPGAGDCLEFCYSFKAWRYPAAFCRQLQNTILLHTAAGREHIRESFVQYTDKAEAEFRKIDFRLYVDGDFDSVKTVCFWFKLLRDNPTLNAYGYSKSFREILQAAALVHLPTNYTLNISSGHNTSGRELELIHMLSITRGEFNAVALANKYSTKDYGTPAYNMELRETYKANTGRNAFPCPGKCGECRIVKGENKHACGDSALKDLDIIIAVH